MTTTKPIYHDRLIVLALGALLALVLGHCHPIPQPRIPIPLPTFHK